MCSTRSKCWNDFAVYLWPQILHELTNAQVKKKKKTLVEDGLWFIIMVGDDGEKGQLRLVFHKNILGNVCEI